MKLEVNIEKKYASAIIGILVLTLGVLVVNALTPGTAPNPGHTIDNIAPPAGCVAGEFLQWSGSEWNCAEIGTNPAVNDLVFTQHSSSECTELSGTVVSDGSGNNFCKFSLGSCPSGWAKYNSWDTTAINTCTVPIYSCEQTGTTEVYCSLSGGSRTCCTTSYHSFGNTAVETCTGSISGSTCSINDEFHCDMGSSSCSCSATITEIGCY